MADLRKAVALIIARSLDLPDAGGPMPAYGCTAEWDSQGHVAIMHSLETAFAVTIPPGVYARLTNINHIVHWLEVHAC